MTTLENLDFETSNQTTRLLRARAVWERDDTLVTSAERLPQATPRFAQAANDGPASPAGTRPFGLRFAVEPGNPPAPVPEWRYCPEQQIALTPGGEPWHRTLTDMTMNTSGPSKDGTGNTGGEEWTPDYLSEDS